MTKLDSKRSGCVSKQDFANACQQSGVKLTNEEIRRCGVMFPAESGDSGKIDFIRMSRDLQLHYSSLNFVGQRASNLETVKEVMSKSGKADRKNINTEELRNMI